MQNKKHIIAFAASLPVILYALLLILPTFDDWSYTTTPYFGNPFATDRILPQNGYWRPFDALLGSVLGLNYRLFPALNHCLILLGHVMSTILVYVLSNRNKLAAAFFFLSPGMLGCVLDIDSVNQTYATFWGLLSLYCYMRGMKWQWIACVLTATFCKENGIMYAVIPPVICFARERSIKAYKPYIADLFRIAPVILTYGIARILLTSSGNGIKSVYLSLTIADHLKDLVQFLCFTWLPIDYEAVVYRPTRCLPLAAITLISSLPFLFLLARQLWTERRSKILISLVACLFLAAAPHLLTLFSVMHTYSGLAFAALIIGFAYKAHDKKHQIAAMLFMMTALVTDIHHWYAAYQSGVKGKEMAEEVLRQTPPGAQDVYVISVYDNEERYSIFNVTTTDAFGWGLSAQFYSGYTCAKNITNEDVVFTADEKSKDATIRKTIEKVRRENKYDAIWLVHDGHATNITATSTSY